MSKRVFAGLLALGLVFVVPASASAHVLKVDGDIGAILHIKPDDNPTTQEPTDYILSFNDNSGRFGLSKCLCTVTVILHGQHITTKPLAVSAPDVSEDQIRFKRPGVYTLRFSGAPKIPGAFHTFTLNYVVRVTNGQADMGSMPLSLWIGMSMGIGLILLGAYAMDYAGTKTTTRSAHEKND